MQENQDEKVYLQCNSCKKKIEEGWKYCPYCKSKRLTCEDCGKAIEIDWKYCPCCKRDLSEIKTSFANSNEWLTNILNQK